MKNIKLSLIRADLDSLNDEFDLSELEGELKHQVKYLVESEMKRNRTAIYQRVAVKNVKKNNNFCGK